MMKFILQGFLIAGLCCLSLDAKMRFGNKESTLLFEQSNSYFVVDEAINNFSGTLKLKDNTPGRIIGAEVVFNNGVLKVGSESDLSFTGTYDPVKNDEMELKDGMALELSAGKEVNKKIKVPSGATATISGSPILKQPIELADATSTLRLAVKSTFDQDLHLNGGKIILDDDFGMTADRKIYGGGIVDVNNKTFKIPGGDFSNGPLEFLNARDVQAVFNFNLSFPWTIGASGSVTDFRGFSLDITFLPGGRINLLSNHTLYFANSNFRSVGIDEVNGVFDIDPTSTMVFQNCCLVMDGTYTHTSGTMTFRDNCTILTQGNNFDVSEAGYLRVEGAVLLYDHVGGTQDNPFTFTDQQSQKVLVDGGVIRSTSALRSNISYFNVATSSSVDINLSPDSTITFVNEVPASLKNATLNLNGASMFFPSSGTDMLNLDPNVVLTVSNIVLNNFNKDVVAYGDANSELRFGDGVEMRLFRNTTIGGADKALTFTGDATICGFGTTLTLDGASRLTITGSKTLTLQGLKIVCKNADSLECLNANSKIVFKDSTLVMEQPGWTFSLGSIDVDGRFEVMGGDPATVSTDSTWAFDSAGDLTVLSGSTLRLGGNVKFEYKADPSGDAGVTYDTKRHFKMTDPTSTLELAGCTLNSTTTGLALDHGRLVVSNTSTLISDGSSGTEAEIGSAVDVYINPAVSLDVTGTLSYKLTTFP